MNNLTEISNPVAYFLEYPLVLVYLLTAILGLATNSIVLFFTFVRKQNRSLSNLFISNQAISDLFTIILCIPFAATNIVPSIEWSFSKNFCLFASYFQGISASVSVLSLLAIGIDRYKILFYSLRKKTIFNGKKFFLCVIFIWLIPIISFSPLLFVYQLNIFEYDSIKYAICSENWYSFEFKLVFEFSMFLIFFLLPSIILIYSYSKIRYYLRNFNQRNIRNYQQSRNVVRERASSSTRTIRRSVRFIDLRTGEISESIKNIKRANRIFKKIIVIFIITWLPYHVIVLSIDLILYIDLNQNQHLINSTELYFEEKNFKSTKKIAAFLSYYVHPVASCIALTNCVTNSFLYCVYSIRTWKKN